MSGGVDSSVAACLLHEQGFDIVGLFMRVGVDAPEPVDSQGRNHQGCCSASDAADARFVAGKLDIPFFALNFKTDFDELIDYFSDEYARARTPNPCVMCNQKLKFGKVFDYADAVGASFVATGHYAQIDRLGIHPILKRAADDRKDQSYVLFGLKRDVLDRIMFPIGHLTKDEVRSEARRFGLSVSDKPDSVDICFVPDRDYARVVRERRPDAFVPGRIVGANGNDLGSHDGIGHFTIGQRRGVGVAAGVPIYVTQVSVNDRTVTVGSKDNLMKVGLIASDANMLLDKGDTFRADTKIRYQHRAAPATVTRLADDRFRVIFDEPQMAPTPGQAVVLYDQDVVIGGGWIDDGINVSHDDGSNPSNSDRIDDGPDGSIGESNDVGSGGSIDDGIGVLHDKGIDERGIE
jgi:tRNA-uridine 2-sulfurtransferase